VPELTSDVSLANGILSLPNARAKLFDGEARASLRYPVAGKEPGRLDGTFTNLPLERFGEWSGDAKGKSRSRSAAGPTAPSRPSSRRRAPRPRSGRASTWP
jgi:hypothetical protein